MALQYWIHQGACDMLRLKELPLGLRTYLDEIEMYANLVDGSIQSRQIVAMALTTYMDRKEILNKVKELEERLNYDE